MIASRKKPPTKKHATPVVKKAGLELDASRKGMRRPEDQTLKDRASKTKSPVPAKKHAVPVVKTPRPKRAVAKETIKAWSYSRYSVWRECAYKAYLKFIENRKEPDNPYQARGGRIHKMAEDYVLGLLKTLPEELSKFKKEFAALRRAKAKAEEQLAFTREWKITDWFAKNLGPLKDAWVRIKTDARQSFKNHTALIVDYKTGKKYMPDHEEQLELYAVAAFILDELLEEVTCEDWYTDSGEKLSRKYTRRADFERLRKRWEARVAPMLADTIYAKIPGDKCRKCHFRASNGGPCNY